MYQIYSAKIISFLSLLMLMSACGKATSTSTSSEDASTSGTVASTVGGAVDGSSGGTMAFFPSLRKPESKTCSIFDLLSPIQSANASGSCPTIPSGGSSCSVSSNTATLTYSECSFGSSSAVWNGSQVVAFTGATPVCGSAFPSAMTSVVRTFGSGTTRTSKSGVVVSVDTTGAYTAANGSTYSGGTTVSFSSGVKTGMTISGTNIWSPLFHHSLTTSGAVGGSAIVISGGNTITSGAVITFHNLAKVKASSTFSGVTISSGCCTPTSGTISTVFSAINGVTPTTLGSKLVGTTETLSFTGCGTATYSGIDGTSGPVTLGHCF